MCTENERKSDYKKAIYIGDGGDDDDGDYDYDDNGDGNDYDGYLYDDDVMVMKTMVTVIMKMGVMTKLD